MLQATLTRRRVLQTALAAGALGGWRFATGQASAPPGRWLLIGGSQGEGIYRAAWDSAKGGVGVPELAARAPQPTYLTMHPHRPVLYACNETDSATTSAVSAFHLDPVSARLQPLGGQLTHGAAPCFASVDRTGSLLFAANYGGGSLAVFPLDHEGKLSPVSAAFDCMGSNDPCGTGGPVRARQSSPHLHCATLSPDNRFVLSCDLGDDTMLVFPIYPRAMQPLGQVIRIPAAAGAGPRHVAFHANGPWLYCMNEINCTVSLYLWRPEGDQPTAQPVPDATVSVRPGNAQENTPSAGAELSFSRDGRFLYTSTRFCDVLNVFSVDPKNGGLTQVQQIACGGKTPRFFALDATEHWLLSANQDSNTITVFARDGNDGRLAPHASQTAIHPECLLWV